MPAGLVNRGSIRSGGRSPTIRGAFEASDLSPYIGNDVAFTMDMRSESAGGYTFQLLQGSTEVATGQPVVIRTNWQETYDGDYFMRVTDVGSGEVKTFGPVTVIARIDVIEATFSVDNEQPSIGDDVTFTLDMEPFSNLEPQLTRNGMAVPGAIASPYTIGNWQESNNGQYRWEVFNILNGTTVLFGPIEVSTIGPTITPITIVNHPVSRSAFEGSDVSFSVAVTGSSPMYQWQVDEGGGFADVLGETSNVLTLVAVDLARNNNQIRVIVTNALGSVTSNVAVLEVTVAPPPPEDLDPAMWEVSYIGTALTVAADGAIVSGVPAGMSGSVSGGVLTVTGVPR